MENKQTQQLPAATEKTIKPRQLKSYDCSFDGEHWDSYNALSRGAAKAMYWRQALGCDFPYVRIKCRTTGLPYTSAEFMQMAKYRGIEFAYCGMAIKVGDFMGVIVGHNESSNLDVLATSGKYEGQVLNCHPHSETTYYDSKGDIVKSFLREAVTAAA